MLILLAATAGIGIGIVDSHLHHPIWFLLTGLAVLIIPLLLLAHRWACRPIDDLLDRVEDIIEEDRPTLLNSLPVDRSDEVGQLARVLHKFSTHAVRDYHEARQLRRTLDDRIERATHLATRNLKELTMRDALTDLGNRRFLDENLPTLFDSCQDCGTDLACIAIDIDHFKPLNDALGHAAGDELLRSLGGIIRATIRHEDYAIRTGGDEFVILMPGCPIARVRHIGEQLIALFRQHTRITVKGNIRPDLSIGIASLLRDRPNTARLLLEKSDAYLYTAKRAGKGRVAGA